MVAGSWTSQEMTLAAWLTQERADEEDEQMQRDHRLIWQLPKGQMHSQESVWFRRRSSITPLCNLQDKIQDPESLDKAFFCSSIVGS